MDGGKVDYDEFTRMADTFIDAGFNYFDTAHGYIGGQSETAIRDCVAKRYDRDQFLLTNKLTDPYFKRQADIRPFLSSSLHGAVWITLISISCTHRIRTTTRNSSGARRMRQHGT